MWPRQPRFKSWCGHFGGVAMLPLPCQLLHAACPLALGPCPPRVHHAWHRGVVPRPRQHRQATAQRMAGAGCARQAPYRSTMPAGNYLLRFCCASSPHLLVVRTSRCGKQGAPTGHPCYWTGTFLFLCCTSSPHRLVVRTSRCGRDNPGSNPGVDIFARRSCLLPGCSSLPAH